MLLNYVNPLFRLFSEEGRRAVRLCKWMRVVEGRADPRQWIFSNNVLSQKFPYTFVVDASVV